MPRRKAFNADAALERAMHLFWRQGYEATSVDELCKTMGIQRGSLYNTFSDKHSLFLQALEHYSTMFVPPPDLITQAGSPRRAIEATFQHIVDEAISDNARRGCFMVNTITELAAVDPDVARIAEQHRAKLERFYKRLLDEAQLAGELPAMRDTTALAQHLVNTLFGLRVNAKVAADRERLETIVRAMLAVLD